ncbi:DUF1573 domain-containing protein [Rubrivirga sp. IMCC45206]|uniref:DUF1573 domain-containing protein n=1 Tax=Rubrivirga sp. IMCC45206 TaxID=3391614 RepID=UPI00398FC399
MTRRLLPLAALLALLSAPASAQGRLAFEAATADLGRFAETGGPVTHTFRFTNAGDAPLRLVAVEASCGCTTPSWTQEPVAPGASGAVEVAYDPAGRPGDFEKTVFVRAEGAEPAAVTLRIAGVVRPALGETGVRVGALAFRATTVDVGEVREGEPFQAAVQFANAGERPVRIERVEAPAGVDVVVPPRAVFPDKLGGLFVTVDAPAAFADGASVRVPLVLHTTDPDAPEITVTVQARLAPALAGE